MGRHFVNTVVRSLLRSPLHRLLSDSLMLMTYTGRISDRTFTIPVLYARHHGDLLVYVGGHERKSWWRNLRGGAPVHIHVGGADFAGRARVVDCEPERRAGYLERFPRCRKALDHDVDPVFVEVTNLQPV
jgi:F420H(2)-dependent quinone reductase